MAKIAEILETERNRQEAATWNVVHMYKTGQFYTAYDWSAWIISVISYTDAVRMQTKDRHPLQVTRIKLATSDDTFCKVGFPFKSIEKFCPQRQDFEGVENDHITFRIPLPQPTDGTDITHERLRKAVDDWTESLPIKPSKPTEEERKAIKAERSGKNANTSTNAEASANNPLTTTPQPGGGLVRQILDYPLTESTPMDNYAFIMRMKQQIASIL